MSYNESVTDDLLTTAEVAKLFRVDRKTVTRWAREGRLHPIRLPGTKGQLRFPRGEVLDMAGPAVAAQLEERIRAELVDAAAQVEPDPDGLAKIKGKIEQRRGGK